ncbi:unnamed protein product, partial [Darwinula stevensoni]
MPEVKEERKEVEVDMKEVKVDLKEVRIDLKAVKVDMKEVEEEVREAVGMVRGRLTSCDWLTEADFPQDDFQHLYCLIRNMVERKESNSLLIIGPPGSGKTALWKGAWRILMENMPKLIKSCTLVELNGLIHVDDRLAILEITRRLRLEDVAAAETFSSHAENLRYLLSRLKDDDQKRGMVIVLEEFQLFSSHRNQTLLYNLFDVAQSSQTPMCVIGVSSRLDVLEGLEKRVKSRFSHRHVYLFPRRNLPDIHALTRRIASLPDAFPHPAFQKEWNLRLDALLRLPSVESVLRRLCDLGFNFHVLRAFLFLVISNLNASHPYVTEEDVTRAASLFFYNQRASLMQGLSILEISLVIAIKHLCKIYNGRPFNFEMLFHEYEKFALRGSSIHVHDKAVVAKAFENLLTLKLLRRVERGEMGSGSVPKEYRLYEALMSPEEISEHLMNLPSIPTDLQQWLTSQLE